MPDLHNRTLIHNTPPQCETSSCPLDKVFLRYVLVNIEVGGCLLFPFFHTPPYTVSVHVHVVSLSSCSSVSFHMLHFHFHFFFLTGDLVVLFLPTHSPYLMTLWGCSRHPFTFQYHNSLVHPAAIHRAPPLCLLLASASL
jgi:hypothetical protein